MPRRVRLDAPGTLNHVIVREIEKRSIVPDGADREDFVERLGELAVASKNATYAWALMTHHAHILLRSSEMDLFEPMRELLRGYAVSYNRRRRILGNGQVVDRIIKEAEDRIRYQLPVREYHEKLMNL